MTRKLRGAAKDIKDHENIFVRKLDKSSVYHVLDKSDYKAKLETIISDQAKFTHQTRNSTAQI